MEGQTCHKTITKINHQKLSCNLNIMPRQRNAFLAFHDIIVNERFIAISFHKSSSRVELLSYLPTRYSKLAKQSIMTVSCIAITLHFC